MATKPISSPIVQEIWVRAAHYGIRDMLHLSRVTGISYDRVKDRVKNPEHITMEEASRLHKTIKVDLGVFAQAAEKGRF